MMGESKRSVIKSWLAVIGGVIIHITLGNLASIGNLNPYLTSYIRARSSPSTLRMADTTWLLCAGLFCFTTLVFVSGHLMPKLGPRRVAFIGGLLISTSVAVSYFSIKWSFWALLLTYGVLYGCGIGCSYPIPIACVIQWLPDKKGLVTGLVMAGFGAGTFIFIQVQTLFINPKNLKPDYPPNVTVPIYFSQEALLDRVPSVFLILGGCFFVLQCIASPMLSVPDESKEDLSLLDQNKNAVQLQHLDEKVKRSKSDKDRQENMDLVKDPKCHHGLTVVEMLRSRFFYLLWFIFFLYGYSPFVAVSMYKVYALTYINDDIFLGIVGSFANVFSSAGRIFWGALGDRYSFRPVMMSICACTVLLFMTFLAAPYSKEGQKPMTFIWVCLIYFTYPGIFPLMSTVISDTFGDKDLATKLGFIYITQGFAHVMGALLNTTALYHIGYVGLYSIVSGCSVAAGLLTFIFDAKKPDGKPV